MPEISALKLALAAYRQGRAEAALQHAARAVAESSDGDFAAHAVQGEVLHRTGALQALAAFLDAHPGFEADPRGRVLRARLLRRQGDLPAAQALLAGLLQADAVPLPLRRMAAFERVQVLSAMERHAEAWEQAEAAHRESTRPFDTAALVEALRQTAQAPQAEIDRIPRASRRVQGVALVLGLPRSGTTLLEQMLDAHPQVCGLGELPLAGECANAMAREGGGWPVGALRVRRPTLDALQAHYLSVTRGLPGAGDVAWRVDKTVFPMMQPLFIHGVLPGSKVLHLVRDARDNAASLFLHNFDPSWGWTGRLDSLREVLAAERAYLPRILQRLRMDVLSLRLSDLVTRPRATLERVLSHLGLPPSEACLQPQHNPRLVRTLSHEKVRQPPGAQRMARWQHHADRFGPGWDALDAA